MFRKREGNPLFMEEVVRSLVALGVLHQDGTTGAWLTRTAVDELRIPDTIQAVIMARIDRLLILKQLVIQLGHPARAGAPGSPQEGAVASGRGTAHARVRDDGVDPTSGRPACSARSVRGSSWPRHAAVLAADRGPS